MGQGVLPNHLWDDPLGQGLRVSYDVHKFSIGASYGGVRRHSEEPDKKRRVETMFMLKGCPRCSGDLYTEKDIFGTFISCVQCGFHKDVASEPADRPRAQNQHPVSSLEVSSQEHRKVAA